MSRLNSILRKLATPTDRELLDRSPTSGTRLRVLGRVGLRFWWAYLLILVVLTVGTVSAGMDVYHRTEQPQFCGACHEMGSNFVSWEHSQHKNITCADCHTDPGARGWVKAKIAGAKQLAVHFSAESIDAIKINEINADHRRTISDNCERCHTGVARLGERLGLGVSHRQHLAKGMDCIECHTGAFTHPRQTKAAEEQKEEEAVETAAATEGASAEPAVATTGGSTEPAAAKEGAAPIPVAVATSAALEQRFVDVAQCYACHDGTSKVGDTVAFSARDEGNCLKCHPDADQALAHGARHASAATRKPCLDCHQDAEGQAHYALGEVGPMCGTCHEQEKHSARHSPYRKGECNECHSVMSQAYLFKTGPRPTNAPCLGCHDEIKQLIETAEPEELSYFSEGSKDLHKVHADELGPKRNDWCIDCHAPHGSSSERALVHSRTFPDSKKPSVVTLAEEGGSCQGGCHEKDGKVAYTGPE